MKYCDKNKRRLKTVTKKTSRYNHLNAFIFLGWCSASQVEQMFLRFYREPNINPDALAKQFAHNVMSYKRNVSPAQIQGYFMFHKNNPDAVINNVAQIWELSDEKCHLVIWGRTSYISVNDHASDYPWVLYKDILLFRKKTNLYSTEWVIAIFISLVRIQNEMNISKNVWKYLH